MQYRQFNFADVTCNVGFLYKKVPAGMLLVVSAIPYGKGAEFRKWRITDIRLSIAGRKIKPSQTSKFFVTKENFWKYPSAVLFAVIGAQIPVSGSDLYKTVSRTGAAAGLGLLALQAQGDIAGERSTFDIDSATADRVIEGLDAIEITIEHPELHRKETARVPLSKSPAADAACAECEKMGEADLRKLIDSLESQAAKLRDEQRACAGARDPAFDRLQRDIDLLETRRGVAYQVLLERSGG